MRADIHNAALIKDHDAVCALRGGNTLRDNDLRTVEIKVRKLVLNIFFGLHIHGGGGVVQNENGRLDGKGARQRDTLLLTAGKAGAALADDRIKAFGQLVNEIDAGDLCEALHVVLGHFGVAVGNVAVYGIGEQEHVLRGDADRAAQLFEIIHTDRRAVHGDGTAGYIRKARDEADKRRFAAAGWSHDGDGLAGFDVKIDVVQNLCAVAL